MTWAVRFRVHTAKKVASDEEELQLHLGDLNCLVKPVGGNFRDMRGLDLRVANIPTREAAMSAAQQLKAAVLLHGAKVKFGIDVGEDRASSSFGQIVRDAATSVGARLMNDVHGLAVYESEGNEVFVNVSAAGSVLVNADMLVTALEAELNDQRPIGPQELTALDLINLASFAMEPLTKATLAIASVELMSQPPPWSDDQGALLKKLASLAAVEPGLSHDDATEVADALGRLFKYSIRQQLRRTVATLGMSARWKELDSVYNLRSGILHGSLTGREVQGKLADQALAICSDIVLAAVEHARQTASLSTS